MSGGNGHISKGFILKARAIEDSEIAHAPPHVREVWDLILRKANFKDRRHNGTTIKRGQWLTRIEEIRELLHWTVGARKERYERHQIENAMKWLRTREMVATAKAARGLFITVVNFGRYQTQDNYECRDGSRDGSRGAAERKRRRGNNGRNTSSNAEAKLEKRFNRFWQVWPKKIDKAEAREVFHRLEPDEGLTGTMIAAVERQKLTEQWRERDGKYIPGPAKWLRRSKWEDEVVESSDDDSEIPPLVRDADGLTPRDHVMRGGKS